VFLLLARPRAVRTAALAAAAVAGISWATATHAAQQRGGGGGYHAPVRAAPHFTAPRPQPQVHVNRAPQYHPGGQTHVGTPNVQHFNRPNVENRQNFGGRQNFEHNNPSLPRVNPNMGRPTQFGGFQGGGLNHGPGHQLAGPASMRQGPGFKPSFPAVSVHNRFFPILRDRKFLWVGGARRFFVPVGLLGVAIIGGSYWYPDGYVSIAGPACTGLTPDGCQLEWRMVDFEDGGGEPQCVQYCPQAAGGPPPAAAAPLPPPPALMESGNCQLTIFADQNFGGLSAPTSENQPALAQTGWQNEISSVQVQSGTWDFFSGDNFSGESLRLTAGQYPQLAPEWTKRIGSFMCVAPGA
jgi:hypothetical protein